MIHKPLEVGNDFMVDDTWYSRPEGVPDRYSAGGIVVRVDDAGEVLLAMVREEDWEPYVLPKGGIEPGETVEVAAYREIAEEAGITDLTLLADLGAHERLNFDRDRWITTRYFLFVTRQIEGTPTDPDHHYGLWWFPLDALPTMAWREQRELVEANAALIRELVAGVSPKAR